MSQVPPPMGTPPAGYPTPGANKPQGLAIGALICGILSLVTALAVCLWFLSIPLGVVAIILGVMAGGKAKRGEAGGAGLAKTGMILGIVGIVLSIVIFAGCRVAGTKLQEEIERQQKILEDQQREQDDSTATPTTTEAL